QLMPVAFMWFASSTLAPGMPADRPFLSTLGTGRMCSFFTLAGVVKAGTSDCSTTTQRLHLLLSAVNTTSMLGISLISEVVCEALKSGALGWAALRPTSANGAHVPPNT